MNYLGPNDCIFSGLDDISFLFTPYLTTLVKEVFCLQARVILWPNDWISGSLNNIPILSTASLTSFVYISSLSDKSFIDFNCYKHICSICMHIYACHLCMHALISWDFAY